MDLWTDFWDVFWFMIWIYLVISFLGALFMVYGDLFRDRTLNGWFKAIWVVVLIIFPVVSVLAYLISRGSGMAARSTKHIDARQDAQEAYIRSVAGISVSEEIAKARALLDAGSITADEYKGIKERALSV
jgi:cytochrome c biogenesis protein CcdA